ncbi:NAD(P)H-flavin reductase [Thalassotalea agarivorans]|uniref:Aquacobalamin reductase / NAD(P)H-flavin reductase n=1 Tax=Thalassotalea agarivorans TaxID=349064 RepID=A0A1I0E937_THASX|nr:NAD(P)H-flavin reductase [Thalassotalea agarivorans]SET41703.1 aquacobalamin reductase / NAD(P)H-flavin reductase [Thalassotalea agarivorans]
MQAVKCQVESLSNLTAHVFKVMLKPSEKVNFLAGQYLNFVMSEDDKRPFSIASSPNSDLIELQIGAFGEDSYAMQVIDRIRESDTVTVEVANGNAYLREESERPLILLAGGTGFSFIKSIFEYLVDTNSSRPVKVYWGLRDESAVYELSETKTAIESLPNGSFVPVVENASTQWQGKTGLVHKAAMADFDTLAGYDIYLAGRFDMIGVLRDDFVAHGADIDHMYADAFAFI